MPAGNFSSNTPGVPAVAASATAAGPGSNGVYGNTSSAADSAVYGEHLGTTGIGVFGRGGPDGGEGVFGQTASGSSGVYGKNQNTPVTDYIPTSTNPGVVGESLSGTGVIGISHLGVAGQRDNFQSVAGVVGSNDGRLGTGVLGLATEGTGVLGQAKGHASIGVSGVSESGISDVTGGAVGVSGRSDFFGVFGVGEYGVWGDGNNTGVHGAGDVGVSGESGNVAIYAHNRNAISDAYLATQCCAGDFYGTVAVHGTIQKFGGGFRIDHPRDPAGKYLSYSFVESSDMKNIYDGIAVLDSGGEAEVELPSWFETLNADFRYQLTCIGVYAPVYIAWELQDNRFKIAGGGPRMKVSWQVTGIRQDPWANANRLPVEEEKPADEQGYYLDPALYGESDERHIRRVRYPQQIEQNQRIGDRMQMRRARGLPQGSSD